ncbi:MAG: glucose-6-phosphate isomerase [Planctomycetes bacterium]|nr:glucose-6-phosphate isomerase [Planctomycetota bacterium]
MIVLRYQNAMEPHIGAAGFAKADFDRALRAFRPGFRAILRDRRKLPFLELPYQESLFSRIEAYARQVRGRFRNLVHIGIGGSALGAQAMAGALLHRFHNERSKPRLYCLDNVDPEETAALFEHVDPRETLFHIVTKSGETTETVAGFLVALDRLRRADLDPSEHVVITTDRKKGFLKRAAAALRVRTFEIPEKVGGRFSALTPVGLLPAAMAGLPIQEIAAGAILADEQCARKDPERNPAFLFALLAWFMDARRGRRIHVIMPYARALRDVADWFRQLWAESLGKRWSTSGQETNTGPTPVLALGATDQHSQIQLYMEGPQDKLIVFLVPRQFRSDVTIPSSMSDPSADFLHGKCFSELLSAEQQGTQAALTAAGRPNLTIEIPQISPRTVGALLLFFEMAAVFAGRLYDINPFDQPGVEAGKKAAFALLGREGHADLRADLERRLAVDEQYTIR